MGVELGKVLREARWAQRLTCTSLANDVGVPPPAIRQWESGHIEPSRNDLIAVCKTLQIDAGAAMRGSLEYTSRSRQWLQTSFFALNGFTVTDTGSDWSDTAFDEGLLQEAVESVDQIIRYELAGVRPGLGTYLRLVIDEYRGLSSGRNSDVSQTSDDGSR